MNRVSDITQISQKGFYCFVGVANSDRRCVVFSCPGCGRILTAPDHTIRQERPLTLEPGFICASGCHYKIEGGRMVVTHE